MIRVPNYIGLRQRVSNAIDESEHRACLHSLAKSAADRGAKPVAGCVTKGVERLLVFAVQHERLREEEGEERIDEEILAEVAAEGLHVCGPAQ